MAESLHIDVYPEILKWARESAGVEIEEASKTLEVPAGTIKLWETSKSTINISTLSQFARLYHRPLAAFLLATPPDEPSTPKDFRVLYGRRSKSLSKETLLAIRKARTWQTVAADLMQDMEIKNFPDYLRISLDDDPEQAARVERARLEIETQDQFRWANPYQAFKAWRNALEEINIFVFQLKMPLDDARGFSLFHRGVPVIVVNRADSITARIFTLFHEFAHLKLGGESLCLHDEGVHIPRGTEKTEKFCDYFAGSMLVPRKALVNETDPSRLFTGERINMYYLAQLAGSFQVSKAVVLKRMEVSNIISRKQYREEIGALLRPAVKPDEGGTVNKGRKPLPPKNCLLEKGPSFVNLVLEAKESDLISRNEMLDYLGVKLKYVDQIVELAQPM